MTVRKLETLKPDIRALITLLFFVDIFIYISYGTRIFQIWGSNNNCYNEVKKQNIHNAIIFIKDPESPADFSANPGNEEISTLRRYNYNSVSFRNEPEVSKGDIIYARDLGDDENRKLKNLYPDRKTYRFEYLGNIKKFQLVSY